MFSLLKYIVFFFLFFNIGCLSASEVVFEPDEEDETENIYVPNFIETGNLPHPSQMREIIDRTDNSPIGRLLILGQYFEARYPDNVLDIDFSQDVALIFPEMTEKEIETTTSYIVKAIHLYRLSKEKIQEFKQKKLAPKDPPLILPDNEYAIVGDREYIPTNENEVAVVSDFKKVIGYGSNPREIEAMLAYSERLFSSRKKQTDFERFRSMLSKLDWSALTSYGVTRPSPFVGNAGIGDFDEKNDFKARLISDVARIGNLKTITLGLHVIVPNHRFMLAGYLPEHLHKPQIKFSDLSNIESYEIFEPMPVQAVAPELIAVYRGDFAFPVKITLKDANKPINLRADISFESCDASFDCQSVEMHPVLEIEAENEGKAIPSSMSNFIHQSLYNIPKENHKDLELNDVSYSFDDNGHISKINFDFIYHDKIKNFAFFAENEDRILFENPIIIIDRDHIYVQLKPLLNTETLLNKPLTITARLNDFVSVRQQIDLQNIKNKCHHMSLFALLCLGVFIGLCFYITPFGIAPCCVPFFMKTDIKQTLAYALSKFMTLIIALIFMVYKIHENPNLLYTDVSQYIWYMNFIFLCLLTFLLYFNTLFITKTKHPVFIGISFALFIFCLIPITPLLCTQTFLMQYQQGTLIEQIILLCGLIFGLMLPEIIAVYAFKVQNHPKFSKLMVLFARTMTYIALCILFLHIVCVLTVKSFFIVLILFMFASLVLKYLFNFLSALYKTTLKPTYIQNTEKIIFVLMCLMIFFFTYGLTHASSLKPQKTLTVTEQQISQHLQNGENVLVAFENPRCLTCLYTRLTVFNKKSLDNLKQKYHVLFFDERQLEISNTAIQFLRKYKRFTRPLYVLYTPLVPNGIVLPDTPTFFNLNKIFKTFQIYSSSSASKSDDVKSLNTNLR